MPSCHPSPPKPSALVCLVCLAVVHRLRPGWVALPLREAAAAEGLRPERLSRLATAAIGPLEQVVARLSRRGRPPKDRVLEDTKRELAVVRALLEVATALLRQLPLRRPAVRTMMVGAWLRLRDAHPELTQKRFCETLGISERTLRHWVAHPEPPGDEPSAAVKSSPSPGPPPPASRPPRRPRFGFDVTLPGAQHAADTTDISAFGVRLKLVASQDVGGRDQDLLEAVVVDERESAEHVAEVLGSVLAHRAGAQVLTDQGSPYMANATTELLEQLEAEHAPQREADPLGKATVERAFGTVKSIAAPVLALTHRLAVKVPALGRADLAIAAVRVLLATILRAYQAGARASRRAVEARDGLDEHALARAAERSREDARATERSKRLLLTHIHEVYDIGRSREDFIRSVRRFPLPVLRDAERAFASQVHRDDIRDRASYFAAIARKMDDEHRRRLASEQREREQEQRLERDAQRHQQQRERWHDNPTDWLRDALHASAAQWRDGRLLCGGIGAAAAWLDQALERLIELHGPALAADIVAAVARDFALAPPERLQRDDDPEQAVAAVLAVLHARRPHQPTAATTDDCAADFLSATLDSTGPPPRPAPLDPLSI